jgi:2-C-methyl-D-erythritol 4-phosphate cytidylyltransferase
MADVEALLPAAGSGERLGRGPKAFVRLAGRSLLAHAVAALAPSVDRILIAAPPGRLADVAAEAAAAAPTTPVQVVAGGTTRQASVLALLAHASADVVVVHDAARPFLDAASLTAVIAAARDAGAATLAMPIVDTLVRDGGDVIDRSGVWAVQTPQAFQRALLAAGHARARERGDVATDDAGLVRALGRPVALVPGGPHLLKVTTPADLAWAERLAPLLAPDRARS